MPKTEDLIQKMLDELDINDTALDLELMRQASKFSYWGSLYAKAARRHALNKIALKELGARIGKDFRNWMKTHEPQTRVTEGIVDGFVTLHDDYQAQARRVANAEYEENILYAAREGFRQRAKNIIELCHMKMDEMIQSNFNIGKRELEERAEAYERGARGSRGLLGGKKRGSRTGETPAQS